MNLIWDIPPPEPVFPEHTVHVFDPNVLGLRQEVVYEDGHERHKSGEKKEEPKLEVAKHSEGRLSNPKCEQHVYRHIQGLPC